MFPVRNLLILIGLFSFCVGVVIFITSIILINALRKVRIYQNRYTSFGFRGSILPLKYFLRFLVPFSLYSVWSSPLHTSKDCCLGTTRQGKNNLHNILWRWRSLGYRVHTSPKCFLRFLVVYYLHLSQPFSILYTKNYFGIISFSFLPHHIIPLSVITENPSSVIPDVGLLGNPAFTKSNKTSFGADK